MTAPHVTGTTRVYGIVADPVAHVQTPRQLNALMAGRGVDGVLVPMHVPPEALGPFVDRLRSWRNFGGFVATVPHKRAMVALCDSVSDQAREVGAVNVVRRDADGSLSGEILDGAGFVDGLRGAGIDPRGQAVFLAGAGGAAGAIAFALAEAGIARLTIHNRTRAAVDALSSRLVARYPRLPVAFGGPDPSDHDIVVNATSLGLHSGDPLPLAADRLHPSMVVAEIIMDPAETGLLSRARATGCRVHTGLPMLTSQIELMARFMGMIP